MLHVPPKSGLERNLRVLPFKEEVKHQASGSRLGRASLEHPVFVLYVVPRVPTLQMETSGALEALFFSFRRKKIIPKLNCEKICSSFRIFY